MSEPETITIKAHSRKQDEAIFSDDPITLLATGVQFGKTLSGALWMKRMMHQHTSPKDNFIVTAPTYKIMEQSSLPAFMDVMEGYGRYNKVDAKFMMHGGGTCYFRTNTEPDAIVGITNVRAVWGDEAGKYTLYFWENMQGRASFLNAPVMLTTSPYALNWVHKDIIKPTLRGLRKDARLIQAASWENPYNSLADEDTRIKKKASMDPRRFNMMYGGEWERMEGLVYDCWEDERNFVEPFEMPVGTQYYGGVDWGYNPDPFVLKVRALLPSGMMYGVSEFCQTRFGITDVVGMMRQKMGTFDMKLVFCDPSRPDLIAELNNNGIPAVKAENGIRKGIDVHYELIKQGKYKEFKGMCPYSADERDSYHYPEPKDLKPDEDSKEQNPVDKDNHCMDADRYLSVMLYNRDSKQIMPSVGAKPTKSRLEFLKSRSRLNRTESWS